MRRWPAVCMLLCGLVAGLLWGLTKTELKEAYATEQVTEETGTGTATNGESPATGSTGTTEEPAFTGKEIFVIFVCCLFSVGICLAIAIYGNPNDRLKDKYRRARKQELLKEKRKKEAEARAIKRAEADAKYEKELAEYEAYMKEYEEAKAAKEAAKAAKKAEKEAKKK